MKNDQSRGESAPPPTSLEDDAYRPRFRPLWNNLLTQVGMFCTLIGVLALVTFGLFSLVVPQRNPYVDIVGLLVLPAIVLFGVVLMPVGIYLKSWRERRRNPDLELRFRFPRVDLNDPAQRRVVKYFFGATFLTLPVIGVTGYHGYHFTDSVTFCGKACHEVMSPQMTTFERSPHARVPCARCHIGSGAGWFVKSKLSGTRQVLAVVTNSYPRPIPPAITELRPARDTCEQCHWPKKFFGSQLREIVHYASDEQNTERRIDMLLHTGGGDESFGLVEGIHLHMALAGSIEYIATDDRLQEIPWVKWTTPAGDELVYRSDGRPVSDPEPEGVRRVVDCMDCHNRPAHKFEPPQRLVDLAIFTGRVDRDIPYIKREAVRAMLGEYQTTEEAMVGIGERLREFYEQNYPEFIVEHRDKINRAIDAVRELYRTNFFPTMRVDWRTYPDNIGHKISAGCFRCHDGNHVNQYGEPISHDCGVCHSFLNPSGDRKSSLLQRGEFRHPYELGPNHAPVQCSKCHTGGHSPVPSCAGCHEEAQALYSGKADYLLDLGVDQEPNPMFDSAECTDCHDPTRRHSRDLVKNACVDCHDESYAETLVDWLGELETARSRAETVISELTDYTGRRRNQEESELRTWIESATRIMERLDVAGGQHNPLVAIEAYEALATRGEEWVSEVGMSSLTDRVGSH